MIKRSIPWNRQPQHPVAIDWSNPLTLGLEFVHNTALKGYEPKSGKLCSYAGSINWNTAGFSATGAGGTYIQSHTAVRLGGLANSTVFALSRTAASLSAAGAAEHITSGGNALYAERGSSGSDIYKIVWVYSSTGELASTLAVEFTYRNDGATLLQKRISAAGLNNNALIASAIVKTGTNHAVYVDGRIDSGTFGSGSTAFTDATVESWVGNDKADATSSAWNGSIPLVIGWSRSLSKAELDSLRQNPWQIFAPQQRNIYVSVAGGQVDYSLTCSAGAYTYTGQSASLSVAHSLSCAAGSYSYSGVATTLTVAHNLVCATGAYTYSGVSAALPVSRSLSCASGSYTYSGVAATLTVRHGLSCDAGSYTYAGVAATLTYIPGDGTVDYVLTCAVGSYTCTGQSATLSVRHSLTCAAGAYAYSGVSASLQVTHGLTCDTGAYTYAGSNAILSVKRSLACATGSYDYIGNTATLDYLSGAASINYVLTCAAGAYTYGGQSATLTVVSSWAGEPFNFASPITRNLGFTSSITKNLNFESPI